MALPDLPPDSTDAWYTWARGVHSAVTSLEKKVATLQSQVDQLRGGSAVMPFYRPTHQASRFVAANPELSVIADQPSALWYGNEWVPDPQKTASEMVTAAAGTLPVVTIYSIPGRDNGQYSAGGLSGPAAYAAWIDKLALGIGTAPVWYVLEPDALGLIGGIPADKKTERIAMLRAAVARLKRSNPNAKVFLDASLWVNAAEEAKYLQQCNPGGATPLDGFSCNVSAYNSLKTMHEWAAQVVAAAPGLKYVVDTSRNGKATAGSEWCNPAGQGLGRKPTRSTGVANCEAYLWVKTPGESDGTCNGGPRAGDFWVARALELVRNAVFA